MPEPGARGQSAVPAAVRGESHRRAGIATYRSGGRRGVTHASSIVGRAPPCFGLGAGDRSQERGSDIEAEFDPETGIVTVYEGRREFRELERPPAAPATASAGSPNTSPTGCSRSRWQLQHAVHVGRRGDPRAPPRRRAARGPREADYAAAVRREAQALRYRAHDKLMRAFLDDAVYDGRVCASKPRPLPEPPSRRSSRTEPPRRRPLGRTHANDRFNRRGA